MSDKIDKKLILKSLLQENYFPYQKKDKEEIPPILHSKCFTPEIADKLKKIKPRNLGYDQIKYKLTRFNNVPRICNIPHPKAYADLSIEISKNWDEIKFILDNPKSLIIPRQHQDGRILIMNYESQWCKSHREIKLMSNKKFIVHTDISSFFPSLYSHAIPWALVGHEIAKEKKGYKHKDEWFNCIDNFQRSINRKETQGAPIGPATSNILAEIILAKIDDDLKNFDYVRFIDDYTCYCKTYEDGEKFIQELSNELSKYNLHLNINKTSINSLPKPISPEWVLLLNSRMPSDNYASWSKIQNFLDYAVNIQKKFLDGSIIKYAVKSIKRKVPDKFKHFFFKYVLHLSLYYPVLIPTMSDLFNHVHLSNDLNQHKDNILFLLKENIDKKRSDAISWILFYLNEFKIEIDKNLVNNLIETGDCIPITILSLFDEYRNEVINFCEGISKNIYDLDQYWILIYQLYYRSDIDCLYNEKIDREIFDILKENNVSFLTEII